MSTTSTANGRTVRPRGEAERHGDEGLAYRLSRSNMLLVGSRARVDALIVAVTGVPVGTIPPWAPDSPPSDAVEGGTVLVRNVHLLDDALQGRLYDALDEWQGRVRVIATSTASVYPLVTRGVFREVLYYRLNMLCLEPEGDRPAAGRL